MNTEESFPAKFTQPQRKVIAELQPALADRLKLDEKNQRVIPFTLNELGEIHRKAREAVEEAEGGVKQNSLWHVVQIALEAVEKHQGIGMIPISERVFQFKITLKDWQPPIWRRIQVKDSTLDKFHERIQTAMSWRNYHLYHFKINEDCYGDPDLLHDLFIDFDYIDSREVKLSEIVPKDGKRFPFEYEYDFGDSWHHEVLFEGCLRGEKGQRYPICLEGERACPPEDVGGVRGYKEYLDVISDPRHEDHDRFLNWSGPFDPDVFDAEKATKRMQRGLPDWRLMR